MDNDFAPTAGNHDGSSINEQGFAAILRGERIELDLPGIIGCPRVNPTGTGLWIEDSHPAAIDAMIVAVLEDFVRRENIDNHFELTDRAGFGYREPMRHAPLNERARSRGRERSCVG